MELTPETAKTQLVQYLASEGYLISSDLGANENKAPSFTLSAIDYIVQDCDKPNYPPLYNLNQRIWKLTHFLGGIANQLTRILNWDRVSDSLLNELVAATAKNCNFTDDSVIRIIQDSISSWMPNYSTFESVAYKVSSWLDTLNKISSEINNVMHEFPHDQNHDPHCSATDMDNWEDF